VTAERFLAASNRSEHVRGIAAGAQRDQHVPLADERLHLALEDLSNE
jgi:hypothetical protein